MFVKRAYAIDALQGRFSLMPLEVHLGTIPVTLLCVVAFEMLSLMYLYLCLLSRYYT